MSDFCTWESWVITNVAAIKTLAGIVIRLSQLLYCPICLVVTHVPLPSVCIKVTFRFGPFLPADVSVHQYFWNPSSGHVTASL